MNNSSAFLLDQLGVVNKTTIIDVGANPLDPTEQYRPLLALGHCQLIGFEPQLDALALLDQRKGPCECYLPHILADGGLHTLHVCRASFMTSLLEPDPVPCSAFHLFDQFTQVIERRSVQTRAMDDLAEIPLVDYLKLNVCGSEKMVLSSGRQKLSEVAVVQLEVAFIPLYRHQPTVGDLDGLLRSMGLVPHTFSTIKKWAVKPLLVNNDARSAFNQLLVAEMIYCADFLHPETLSDERLKQMVLILHYCYHSYDMVLRCLYELANRGVIAGHPDVWYLKFVTGSQS